jgi:hypothetical protein
MPLFSGFAVPGNHGSENIHDFVADRRDRIMWCWIYTPEKLPRSYVRWIGTLAHLDPRLKDALKALREGTFSYEKGTCTPPGLLSSLATELGLPASWGDPSCLPARGSEWNNATVWRGLGVKGRNGLGGVPCDLVHGGVGRQYALPDNSCAVNAGVRLWNAFMSALLIYLPVRGPF